ncbi:MAG: response regulator [Candidatus Omnitrophota bacterium]
MTEQIEPNREHDIRVLIVDDEVSIRNSLSAFLEDNDFQVSVAATAEEALSLIEKSVFLNKRYHTSIVDIRLPGMDGDALIIRAHEISPTTHMIVYTGSSTYQISESLKKIGVKRECVFVKPLKNMSVLLECIKAHGERLFRSPSPVSPQKKYSILIIEDEAAVRKSSRNFLEDYNYQILEAENGRIGLEIFEKEKPDLVLVDLRMPEINGMEVLARIRKQSPDTPIIIMSGTGVIRDVVEALRLGAWNYLLKPIEDLTVLRHAVEKALERARLIRENRLYQEHLEEEVKRRTFELEKTAQELRKSEEKYRSIYENLQDIYFETLPDGHVLEVSPSLESYFHFKPDRIIGKKINDFYVYPAERERLLELLSQHGKVTDYEITLDTKFGEIIPCSITAHFQYDSNHQPLKICGTLRDIRERKQAEMEKGKLTEQLNQAQKIEALGSLTGGIAHDFNNLLTVINGHAEMALRKLEKNIPIDKDINAIWQAGKRAEKLTRQLLAFSRKQIYKPTVLELNEILSNMKSMLIRLIGEDIRMDLRYGSDLTDIKADPGQIEQVVMNLIVNARDAINENKGGREKRITIETQKVMVDKRVAMDHPGIREGNYVVLSVSDTGIGMTEEVKSKIFEPFFTTKEKGKGTGLGLSTVYGIARQNRAHVCVHSEPGQGARFEIFWPVAEEVQPVEKEPVKASADLLKGNETILLVEDDKDVRNFACHTLRDLGYSVIEAANGREALEVIEKNKLSIDLVLTDMIMPEMNGAELARHIKLMYPDTLILYASGYIDHHLLPNYRIEEADHFIQKPYSFLDLAQNVRNLLDKNAKNKK